MRMIRDVEVAMTVKQQALEVIHRLPDDCTLEDVYYHLYVREKVAAGRRAMDAGDLYTHEQAEAEVESWFPSSGPVQP